MKRILCLCLVLVMMLGMAACGNQVIIPDKEDSSEQDTPNTATPSNTSQNYSEEEPNQELDWEYEQKVDQGLIDPVYGLDLSGYDEHGNWSSDRMWVKKTENSWDAVHTYYGYIDTSGNLVGQWHEEGGIYYMDKAEMDAFSEATNSSWKKPGDFCGNYAFIDCGDCTEIIDLDGNTVFKYAEYSVWDPSSAFMSTDGNRCVQFYYPHDDQYNLHMLSIEDSVAEDITITGCDYIPAYIQKLNDDYFTYVFNSNVMEMNFFGLISKNGELLVNGTLEGYEVVDVYPPGEGYAGAITFVGADKKTWGVKVTADGTWIGEPFNF